MHSGSRGPHLIALLLLVACQDYRLTPRKDDVGTPLDTDPPPPGEDIQIVATPNSCLDDDGLAITVAYDETCAHDIEVSELEAQVEWSMEEFGEYPEYTQVLMTPVVGQLTDDDGDGAITRDDVPDIVVLMDDGGQNKTNARGVIRSIAGNGEYINFTLAEIEAEDDITIYPYRYSGAALGDLDGDGDGEILFTAQIYQDTTTESEPMETGPTDTTTETGGGEDSEEIPSDTWEDNPVRPPPPNTVNTDECYLVAITGDGELFWLSQDLNFDCGGHAPAVADLDGDGTVEVVLGPHIFAGEDGTLVASGESGTGNPAYYEEMGYISVVSDLDGDGQQEILAGNTVYDSIGATVCTLEGADDGFPAAADLDMDGQGEFVSVGNGAVRIYEADCTEVTSWAIETAGSGGPPTVADFDADGLPEIGIAGATAYMVYEVDGTLLWSMPVSDASSHATGSSVHDFESDGQSEVIYADETTLWVFDGATGVSRLADTQHTSRTLHEYPVAVDVDGDGSTEILVPNGGGHYAAEYGGIYVLGDVGDGWYGNRQVWNQHAYNIVNIDDDLRVPAAPESNWPEHNNFRSGDPNPVSAGASADAVPLGDTCTEECDTGVLIVYARVGNSGAGALRSGVPVSLYADYGIGRVVLETQYTTLSVDAGLTSDLLTWRLDPRDIEGATLVVVVDDEAGVELVPECHEDNNELELEEADCL